MNLIEMFPISFLTNMDYRPDRLTVAMEEVSKIGISPIRLPGVVFEGTSNKVFNGYIGCGLCHLNGLKLAREQDKNVLMLEDDVMFINDYKTIIESALNSLPEDWDMFYLGGNVCAPITQVSEHLGRLSHSQSTHAYGVNKNFLSYLIDYLEPNKNTKVIDMVYGNEIIPNHNCFMTVPLTAIQREGKSDIEGDYRNFNWMEQRFYEQLRPLCH